MTGHVEIVHTPHLAGDQGVLGPNPEPWHVRIVGGNNEILQTGEPLHSKDDAETEARSIARVFGATEPAIWHSSTGDVLLGCRRSVEIRYITVALAASPDDGGTS